MDDEDQKVPVIELIGTDGDTLAKMGRHWHPNRGPGMWEWME